MPELPDIELYIARLRERILDEPVEKLRFLTPFVLHSVEVPPAELECRLVVDVFRLGKRIVLELQQERFIVIHLMIAGRLHWVTPVPASPVARSKALLATIKFPNGQLNLVEMSTKKRASIYLVRGREGLKEHMRGGLNVLESSLDDFSSVLLSKNRTLKRALTDPSSFDGIGNAYSDEILFAAKLSPLRLTQALKPEEVERLYRACASTLEYWRDRLQELYVGFPRPGDVTAFRKDFATHGKFKQPCPVCGSPIQHIVYAENETNYCAKCQNEGRLLADRSLSRLLKSDWPKTLEEMEEGQGAR